MSNTDQADTKPVVERIAVHELLGAGGAVVEDENEATGIKYTLKASGKSFQYQVPGITAGTPAAMLAVFGAKTLATNEASQVRQKDPDGDQLGAIEERFLCIEGGKWVDRTGGVGAKTDLDVLAAAVAETIAAKGGSPDKAKIRAMLDDATKLKMARGNPDTMAAYSRLMGRTVKSVDDVVAAFG